MPRTKAGLKCEKCGQSFKLPMHLGRHMTTRHGETPKTAKPVKRRRASKKRTRRGRPRAAVGGLNLRGMSLDQLMGVITAVKEEAHRRIAELQEVVQ